jgi:hypothetical protein
MFAILLQAYKFCAISVKIFGENCMEISCFSADNHPLIIVSIILKRHVALTAWRAP